MDGYKVGIDLSKAKDVTVESFNMELKRTNEKMEVIFSRHDINVEVEFFWDSHGTLIPWSIEVDGKEKKSYCRVKACVWIVKNTFTMMDTDWETWSVSIRTEKDGLKKFDDVKKYSYNPNSNILRIKSVVGWG